jgi:hypothetical protein
MLFPRHADEADALARHGLDQTLSLSAVPNSGARGIDAGRQRRFRHDASAPNRGDQIVLADHAAAFVDQILKHVEDLGFEAHTDACA